MIVLEQVIEQGQVVGGVVDDAGSIVEELRVESPATDTEALEKAIEELVTELKSRHEIASVGVGAAGYIDKARATVMFAPNIAWRYVNLKADRGARRLRLLSRSIRCGHQVAPAVRQLARFLGLRS